jgi:hypothetical protein
MLEGPKVTSITLKVLHFEIHDLWDSKRINMKIKTLASMNRIKQQEMFYHDM